MEETRIGYNVKTSKIMECRKSLLNMYNELGQIIEKRRELIDFKGYTDKEEQRLDCKYNPESYYSFRYFGVGCEIIYTHNFYDAETDTWYRNQKKYCYAIKYYNCRSRVFKDKRCKLPFYYDNTSYGQFDNLDVAISYFKKAVVDILVQYAGCLALDPLDFI